MVEVSDLLAGLQPRYIFVGELDKEETRRIIGELIQADSSGVDSIRMIINSPGGNVNDMFAVYDTMRSIRPKILTTGVGTVASASVLLLAAGEKGHRAIGPNTRLMLHEVSLCGMEGKLFDLKVNIDECVTLQGMMERALSAESKLSIKEAKKIVASYKDEYISPEEAVKFGLCDIVVPSQ